MVTTGGKDSGKKADEEPRIDTKPPGIVSKPDDLKGAVSFEGQNWKGKLDELYRKKEFAKIEDFIANLTEEQIDLKMKKYEYARLCQLRGDDFKEQQRYGAAIEDYGASGDWDSNLQKELKQRLCEISKLKPGILKELKTGQTTRKWIKDWLNTPGADCVSIGKMAKVKQKVVSPADKSGIRSSQTDNVGGGLQALEEKVRKEYPYFETALKVWEGSNDVSAKDDAEQKLIAAIKKLKESDLRDEQQKEDAISSLQLFLTAVDVAHPAQKINSERGNDVTIARFLFYYMFAKRDIELNLYDKAYLNIKRAYKKFQFKRSINELLKKHIIILERSMKEKPL